MRSSWLTLAMNSRRDFSAASMRVIVVQHGERSAGGHGSGIDLEDAPGSQRTGAAGTRLALLQRRVHTGQQFGIAHRVDQRPADANLRAGDALHRGVGPAHQPFGSDGDHRLLHGIEHGGQLLAAALDLGKALAQPLGRLVQRGLHGSRANHRSVIGKAGAQARPSAMLARKGDHPLQPRGDAAGNPDGQGQRHGQRDQAGPENLMAEKEAWSCREAAPVLCRQ